MHPPQLPAAPPSPAARRSTLPSCPPLHPVHARGGREMYCLSRAWWYSKDNAEERGARLTDAAPGSSAQHPAGWLASDRPISAVSWCAVPLVGCVVARSISK